MEKLTTAKQQVQEAISHLNDAIKTAAQEGLNINLSVDEDARMSHYTPSIKARFTTDV